MLKAEASLSADRQAHLGVCKPRTLAYHSVTSYLTEVSWSSEEAKALIRINYQFNRHKCRGFLPNGAG